MAGSESNPTPDTELTYSPNTDAANEITNHPLFGIHLDKDDLLKYIDALSTAAGLGRRQSQVSAIDQFDTDPLEQREADDWYHELGKSPSSLRSARKNIKEREQASTAHHHMTHESRPKVMLAEGEFSAHDLNGAGDKGRITVTLFEYLNREREHGEEQYPRYGVLFERFRQTDHYVYSTEFTGSEMVRFSRPGAVIAELKRRLKQNKSRANPVLFVAEVMHVLGMDGILDTDSSYEYRLLADTSEEGGEKYPLGGQSRLANRTDVEYPDEDE